MYSRVGGKRWIKQIVVGAFLFPAALATVGLSINSVAIYYHASRAIPFTTMVRLVIVLSRQLTQLGLARDCVHLRVRHSSA